MSDEKDIADRIARASERLRAAQAEFVAREEMSDAEYRALGEKVDDAILELFLAKNEPLFEAVRDAEGRATDYRLTGWRPRTADAAAARAFLDLTDERIAEMKRVAAAAPKAPAEPFDPVTGIDANGEKWYRKAATKVVPRSAAGPQKWLGTTYGEICEARREGRPVRHFDENGNLTITLTDAKKPDGDEPDTPLVVTGGPQ